MSLCIQRAIGCPFWPVPQGGDFDLKGLGAVFSQHQTDQFVMYVVADS
jgi:hypothetical protein